MARWLYFLLLLAAPALGDPMRLQFWHSMTGEKGLLLKSLIAKFNEGQKTIAVELQFVGTYEEGLNKLRTSLLAKRGPHLAQITDVGTQVMIDTEATVPLGKFLTEDPDFPLAKLLPPIRHYYEVQGALAALPFATSNPILFYNLDLFEKAGLSRAPATFSELKAYAAKLTNPTAHVTGVTWPLHGWFLEQFLARQGALFVDNGNGRARRAGELLVLAPEALRFLTLWQEMVKAGTFANVGRGWDPAEQNFLAGRTAMFITSTSEVFEVSNKAPFRVATAPIPKADGVSAGGTIVGGNAVWILKRANPAEEKASYQVLKFLASAEAQREWHTRTGYFPIRQDVIDTLTAEGFYKKYPAALTAIRQLESSPDSPATRGALLGVFPEVRENVMVAMEKALTGAETLEAALQKAKKDSEAAMRRYNRGRAAAGK